jgi:hypothetical protein
VAAQAAEEIESMNDRYILDESGNPQPCADLATWARAFDGTRHIAMTDVDSSVAAKVSTVFLGLDHRFGGEGPPIVFETMVFGGALDGEQERYCTKAEALAGHEKMVARVRAHKEKSA